VIGPGGLRLADGASTGVGGSIIREPVSVHRLSRQDPPKTKEGIPLITAKNVRMGYLNREPREYISKPTFKTWMMRGFPEIGDLFFTTEAPLANICVNNIKEPFALAQRVICFQPYGKIDTKFLMFAIMSDDWN
jgi:type I restriction enzyme, S subunit